MTLFSNLIPHGNLTPAQGFIFFMGMCLFGLVGYAIYLTFGSGKKDLRDAIDEHAKMHELGIAHTHKEGTYRAIMDKKEEVELTK